MANKTTRMNISVPTELRARMRQCDYNWSEIAAEAFARAISQVDVEDLSLEPIVDETFRSWSRRVASELKRYLKGVGQ